MYRFKSVPPFSCPLGVSVDTDDWPALSKAVPTLFRFGAFFFASEMRVYMVQHSRLRSFNEGRKYSYVLF